MQTLNDIWLRRIEKLKDKTWLGSNPKSGFDFSNGIKPELLYENENWYDLTIQDFRTFLTDIRDEHMLDNISWNNDNIHGRPSVSITPKMIRDQSYFIIDMFYYGVFSVSIYKNRGRIDCIIDLEYGTPISLVQLTEILYRCGLEEMFSKIALTESEE